jgi:hypothetical protein
VFLYQWIFQKDIVIYAFIFSFGLNIMDITKQNDIQITEKGLSHTIIGGRPDSINWLEEGFKMDIFPDSFPPDVPVDITISTHQGNLNNPKLQLLTQIYKITLTASSSGIVLLHLEHNLVFNGTNIDQIYLLLQNYEVQLLFLQNLSKYYMSSQFPIKTKFNNYVCGVRVLDVLNHNSSALANQILRQTYSVSFYGQESSNYLIIAVVIAFPGDESIDSKYSRWIKDPKSPYKGSLINGRVNLTVEPSGCWDKLESEEYTQIITKGEYFFKLKWKCSWWPHYTYLKLQNSRSGIIANVSTTAGDTILAMTHINLMLNSMVIFSIVS